MKANYRRFKRTSKGYSRISSKGDLHRALSEEELDLLDESSPRRSGMLADPDDDADGRVVLTRGGPRSGRDRRFDVLRSWQRERTASEWDQIDADSPPVGGGWFARIWRRLRGR